MKKELYTARELKGLYEQGRNIVQTLRAGNDPDQTKQHAIQIAYDLQAGSYVQQFRFEESLRDLKRKRAKALADLVEKFAKPKRMLDAGCGEAIHLAEVLKHLDESPDVYAFDISWSRAAHARRWLRENGFAGPTVMTGNLLSIPLVDKAVDLTYTVHSIEPNGGAEATILTELARVTRDIIILVEPGYEFAGPQARARMERLGYCKGLAKTAEDLGLSVLMHEPFMEPVRESNPSALTVLACPALAAEVPAGVLACPKTRSPVTEIGGFLYCEESLSVYPILGGIPCLCPENAILASQYLEMVDGGLDDSL